MRSFAVIAAFLFLTSDIISGYQHLRLQGLLPSFNDPGYPPDDVIKNNNVHEPNGETANLGFTFDAWGYSTTAVKIFDDGYLLLDPTEGHEEYDGNFERRKYPYVAPLWMPSNLPPPNVYHVAFRTLYSQTLQPERAHDFDRIRNEINKALDLYPASGQVQGALIVTWKIGDLAGNFNKFQAVLAKMDMGTEVKDFVFFYYDSVMLMPGGPNGLSVWVNGDYGPAASAPSKFATACGSTVPTDLIEYSNHQCSDRAMFLFDMSGNFIMKICFGGVRPAGTECSTCTGSESDYDVPNCMIPWVTPQDTCTETFHCSLNDEGTIVTLNATMRYYAFSSFTAIDYTTFIGTGTVEDPTGGQVFITSCQKNGLLNPGTPNALDTFEFTFNIDPLDNPLPCGITWDPVEEKLSFAFTIYDPLNPEVDLDGKFIFYGDCYPRDLATQVSVAVSNNHYNQVVDVVRSPRQLNMKWIDRPDALTHLDLTSVKVGRDLYSLLCFDPGTPYHADADPFGAKIEDCFISNNAQFNHNPLSGIGDQADRAVKVFDNGCVSRSSSQAYYFDLEYKLDPQFDVKGGTWCLVSGKMEATPFNTDEKKLWMMCTLRFCTNTDDTTCDESCQTNRRKRSVSVNTTGTGTETITIELNFEDEEPTTQQEVTSSETKDCVNMTTAIAVLAILVVIILIAFVAAVVIGSKLLNSTKNRRKK